VVGIGAEERVLVTDLGKVIVAWVGVAALAVVELVADRVVVVALDAKDFVFAQEFETAVRARAKATEVAQAVDRVDVALLRILQRNRQSKVIAINASETGDTMGGGHARIVWILVGLSRWVRLHLLREPSKLTDMKSTQLVMLAGRLAASEISAAEFLRQAAAEVGQPEIATVDLERASRCGFPEVIYGSGKTAAAIAQIAGELLANEQRVLVTRVQAEKGAELLRQFPAACYNEVGRTLRMDGAKPRAEEVGHVAVITAGTSDLPVAEEARETLAWMGVRATMVHDVGVAGPHRLPERLAEFAEADAIVVVAGMEGALPSVVGGYVPCPLFAVPTSVGYGASLGGLSALLAMLNSCASNVAVVNIDAGFKAGYLAGLVATRRRV